MSRQWIYNLQESGLYNIQCIIMDALSPRGSVHQVVNSLQKRRIVIAREAERERGNLAPVTICSSQRERPAAVTIS